MLAVSGVFFIGLFFSWALLWRVDFISGDEYPELCNAEGDDDPRLSAEFWESEIMSKGRASALGVAEIGVAGSVPGSPIDMVISADVCEAFIRSVFQRLSREVEIRELNLDMGAMTISLLTGAERRTCLLSGFEEDYRHASSAKRDEYIALVVDSILQQKSPENFSPSEILQRLRPRIRDIYSGNMLSLAGHTGSSAGLASPLGCSRLFQVSLSLDYPSCSFPARTEDLDMLGLSELELGRIARENLFRDIERSGRLLEMVSPGLYFYTAEDGFNAPSLILADLLRETKLHGQAIAAFADASTIILTGSHDFAGLAAMAEILAEGVNIGLPLLPGALLLRDDHAWCDFATESASSHLPQAHVELQTAFNNIQQASVVEAYTRLQPMMAERYGQDVCVAEVVLREFAADVLKAVVIIPDDAVHLILPCTEMVELAGKGKKRKSLSLDCFLQGKTCRVQPLAGINGYLLLSPE
ncbi:MAG: hypothetical protein PHC51_04225 [bacterium]|nr:hypothetical protein [bacterium]